MKKKTLRRSFDFEIPMYEKLMADAAEHKRSFPQHIMWILEKYLEKKDESR